jgi:GT2 family glycosyltransferase
MPNASVIIATHNRATELDACLGSLARASRRDAFEIVVVDNGSQDATRDVLARHAGDGVRAIFVADPNRAKARNAGIAAARARLVIFCDDDTIVPTDYVAEHLRAHHDERRPAVVSGPIVNVPDRDHLIEPAARHYSRAFFCTCNVSVPKADLEAVGGFDERYDLYGWEDTDLGIRLRARGLVRLFAWSAYIYHIKPPSVMTLERRRALAVEKGTMAARFVRKAPTWPVRLATGAYGANFARAAIVNAPPLRAWYERLARTARPGSLTWLLASDAVVDAAYLDALKSALRHADG